MVTIDPLLSDDPDVVAGALWAAIHAHRASTVDAQTGVNYYEGQHDILENRIFYMNDAGHLVEDRYAANVRIPHPFLRELIDQKVTYLLGTPVAVCVEDDEDFTTALEEYYGEDFHVFLQDLLSGSSQKGVEYAFARTTREDRLTCQVADSLLTFPVYDAEYNEARIVRAYEVKVTSADRRTVTLTRAEVWDDKVVTFYVAEDAQTFVLDPAHAVNPRPHVVAQELDSEGAPTGELVGRDYGVLPFYRVPNNPRETSDLVPVKPIIDDYDVMNAYLSNNLQDFTDALYVVKGYPNQDLDELRQNLKAKKAVAVGEGGDVDIRTVEIPVEGRTRKMEIDKENIYRFGMGFDSTQVGDGNITNIVIKARYALLDMKVNKAEARLKAFLQWFNRLVVADINRRKGTSYDPSLVKFEFSRDTPVNELDGAQVEFTEAQALAVRINAVLAAAGRFDDETVLKLLADLLDLDWEEVQERLEADAVEAEPLDPTLIPPADVPPVGTGAPAQTPPPPPAVGD